MQDLDKGARATPIEGAEVIAQARAAEPKIELANMPLPNDPKPGARVSVTPDDYGRDPVAGVLISIGPDHVIIRRETPETGALHVHFPRWGYRVIPA